MLGIWNRVLLAGVRLLSTSTVLTGYSEAVRGRCSRYVRDVRKCRRTLFVIYIRSQGLHHCVLDCL